MRVAVVVVAALIGAATVAATTGAAPEPLVVHHKVEAGESWQTIASRYQISLAELNTANDRSPTGTGSPRVGRIVHVPAPVPSSTTTTSVPVVSSTTTTSSVPPTTVGSTTTTVAPTTTSSTTSVVPSTTVPPSTVPTPTTTAPDTTVQFAESFTGNTGKDRFRIAAFHRERDGIGWDKEYWVSSTPWQADHAGTTGDCGAATEHHPQAARNDVDWPEPITFYDDQLVYVCNGHMMSTIGDVSGYSITLFSPDMAFPDVDRVCFDASINGGLTGDRAWWEVAVQPYHTKPAASAIEWLAGTANVASYGDVGAVVLSFGPANPHYYRISVRDISDEGVGGFDDAAFNDASIRRAHCFTDTAAGLRFESWTRNPDGTLGTKWNDTTVAGDFPVGPLEVVFKSHAYTPTKSCWQYNLPGDACASYSWHWDQITVN
jgi:hypothetical protein